MSFSGRHMKFWTIVLLAVLLCLPFSGPVYTSELTGSPGTSHTGFVCVHEDTDYGHESGAGHALITHCHELDAPCDAPPPLKLDYPPAVSTLTSPVSGSLLPGHDIPIEFPPENHG